MTCIQVSGQVVNVLTMTLFLLLALVLPTWIQGTDHMWYTVSSVIDLDWLRQQWWWPLSDDCEHSVTPTEHGDVALRTGSEGQPAVQVSGTQHRIYSQAYYQSRSLQRVQFGKPMYGMVPCVPLTMFIISQRKKPLSRN